MPRTSRPMQAHPIVLRRATVERVVDVTPHMRRLTLSGPDLAAGVMGDGYPRPAFRSDGFDDHVKLVVPPAEGELPRIGTQEEQRFAWNPEVLAFTRDYTVRAWDSASGRFDVDVVRHDHGLASSWAYRAQPGDEIHFAGPKSCAFVNTDADWHLLVGDETALPAIGRWLDEASAGMRARVIVEVPTADDRQEFTTKADAEIDWLVRDDVPAGRSTLLFEAVRDLTMPEGRVYAWVGGEAMTIAPIRRYLRGELGLPKDDVEVVGYWRLTSERVVQEPRDSADRLAPPEEGDETALDLTHDVHEMTELGPPIVTRAAVTLGIGPLVAAGHTTLTELAERTGVAAGLLSPLLDAMQALGLLDREGDVWRNTARGGVLMEDTAIEELSLDNPANAAALALVDLVDVLRSGIPSPRAGRDGWRARRATDPAFDAAYHDLAADSLQYVLEPLTQLPVVARASTLAVLGDAAAYVATGVAAGRHVHLPADTAASWPAHDCAILVGALEGRDDEGATALLRTALSSGPALVVAESLADAAAVDEHAAEHALTSLALTGAPQRTSADVERLLRTAGARTVESAMLGWGFGRFGSVIVAHA
ncbi:siderophore-interacting protein [Aeromicrobium camelliae]|uniref:Siderophore-interacting protein n=1 Tax=Aeromicrobium camelliae TaxID=1538144 RepID=A0A3N6ZSL9_9ACTN|nr:siderophore-interacting protein [Aeromicrobium camelliae]RQN09997.1 siderophore-interacting protein [Aeromicrobium camelliae]